MGHSQPSPARWRRAPSGAAGTQRSVKSESGGGAPGREPVPPAGDILLGAGSSLVGLTGLLFLYRALATGQMTIAAPVSALFAALIPVVFGFLALGQSESLHLSRHQSCYEQLSLRHRIYRKVC